MFKLASAEKSTDNDIEGQLTLRKADGSFLIFHHHYLICVSHENTAACCRSAVSAGSRACA
jgi:hypothetical protein